MRPRVDGVTRATPPDGTSTVIAGQLARDETGPGERFTGRLADARVYDTAKDAAWWRETYARGVGSYEGQ